MLLSHKTKLPKYMSAFLFFSFAKKQKRKMQVSIFSFSSLQLQQDRCYKLIVCNMLCNYTHNHTSQFLLHVCIHSTVPASMLHPSHYLYYLQGQSLNYLNSHSFCQQSMMITHNSKDGHSMHSMQLCNAR